MVDLIFLQVKKIFDFEINKTISNEYDGSNIQLTEPKKIEFNVQIETKEIEYDKPKRKNGRDRSRLC